jgi:membrane protein YqaA with SNARE-associated domain
VSLLLLFAWTFAAATILPLSSEVALALEVMRRDDWLLPVLIATIGNVLGAATTYALARFAVTRAPAPSPRVARASALLARYGAPALLLSWVPVIGDLIVALTGAARMPLLPFAFWTTAGKAARYVAVALAVTQR